MKIEFLRLKGFIGIQRGLGLDEIAIDFSRTEGLIAFQGENGVGKSVCLESLSPYPMLASRDGALSHHVCSRAAEKELAFAYAGHSYRTLIKIDGQSERSEGFIFKDGQSEVKGRISEYSRYIKNLLGSPELFFTSVFCAQGSKKLSDMTTGDLKRLFAEFLRLDRLQAWEQTAKQIGNVLNGKVSQIDIRRSALSDRLAGIEALDLEHAKLSGQISDLEARKTAITEKIRDLRAQIEALRETCSKNQASRSRKADLEATIARMEKDLARNKQASEDELEAVRGKFREIAGQIKVCEEVLKDREQIMGAAERERVVTEQVESLTPRIETLTEGLAKDQEATHIIEVALKDLKQVFRKLEDDEELRTLDKAIADLDLKTKEQERKIKKLEEDRQAYDLLKKIERCKEQMETLDLRDPACASSTCSFIVSAIQARDAIPHLEANLQARNDTLAKGITEAGAEIQSIYNKITARGADRNARCDFLEAEEKRLHEEVSKKERERLAIAQTIYDKKDALEVDRQALARARTELAKVKELAGRKGDIQVAEARLADLEKRLDESRTTGTLAKEAWEERESQAKLEIGVEKEKLEQIEKEIDPGAEEELKRTQSALGEIETKTLPALESEMTASREKVVKVQADLDRMREAGQELEALNGEREHLQQDVSEWLYLKNACGKDGLQALEIDGTAPLISAHANDLLSRAFGPLYSIRLRTQDDEGREVLDIVVIGEDGEEVLLENLSGGQKVWCLMALRLAMTLLCKEKSGRAFESFFSDEMDGPLDPDNAINFINMYQGFMKIGGFSNGFFISHRPSCRALADHVLAFEAGKAPYWK